MDAVLNTNIWELHTFLAHKLDKQKLEAKLRKGNKGNAIEL